MLGFSLLLGAIQAQGQAEAPLFSFGAIADVQYCDCDASPTRAYRNSPAKLDAALADLAAEDLTFIVHLGDLIDRNFDSYDTILPHFEKAQVPVHFVPGNHDFSVADSLKEQVAQKLGLERLYHDFSINGWRFVLTDGNERSLYAAKEGTKRHRKAQELLAQYEEAGLPQAQKWNGGMGRKQMKWLRKVLKDAQEKGERVILFSHFPIFPSETHNLWNDTEVVNLLESFPNVAAWINGHNHAGGYAHQNGIHYLILHGMVDTPDTSAYAVVDVYADQLVVRGRGREPVRVLDLKP